MEGLESVYRLARPVRYALFVLLFLVGAVLINFGTGFAGSNGQSWLREEDYLYLLMNGLVISAFGIFICVGVIYTFVGTLQESRRMRPHYR